MPTVRDQWPVLTVEFNSLKDSEVEGVFEVCLNEESYYDSCLSWVTPQFIDLPVGLQNLEMSLQDAP